jgi:RNA 3'-terminal phosphate cyclase
VEVNEVMMKKKMMMMMKVQVERKKLSEGQVMVRLEGESAEGLGDAGQTRLPVGGEALDSLEDVLAVHVCLGDHVVLLKMMMTTIQC